MAAAKEALGASGRTSLPPLTPRSADTGVRDLGMDWTHGSGFGQHDQHDGDKGQGRKENLMSKEGIEHAQRETKKVQDSVEKWNASRVVAVEFHKQKVQELNTLNKNLREAEDRYNQITSRIHEKEDKAARLTSLLEAQTNTLLGASQGIKKMNKKLAVKGRHFRNLDKSLSGIGYAMGQNAARFSDEASARYTKLLQYDTFPEPA